MSDFDFESFITDIPDYPEPGVVFKDITPLFADANAMRQTVLAIADHFRDAGITKVVGPEARGFMIGVPVAMELGAGFIPARKPGSCPVRPTPLAMNSSMVPIRLRFIAMRSNPVTAS